MADANSFDQFDSAPSPSATAAPAANPFDKFDEKPTPEIQAPDETIGRVAGLAARGVGTGTAGLPDTVDMLVNPISHLVRQALTPQSAGPYKPQLSDFVHPEKWQDAAEYFADKAGMPKPETPGERIGYKAAQALPSAALSPEAPILGGLSAVAGAGASQAAQESGVGPMGQLATGLLAGSVPAATSGIAQGVRRLVSNPGATAERLADAAQSGTQLNAGQASGSKTLQYLAGISSKLWGGAPLERTAEQQTQSMGNYIENIVNRLSSGKVASPTTAGAAVSKGAETEMANMRQQEAVAYNKLDGIVPPTTPIDVSSTLTRLDSMARPTPGAEATTGALIAPKIKAIRDNLTADMASNAAQKVNPDVHVALAPQPDAMASQLAQETADEKAASTLPYSGVKGLRTALGNSIDWGFAPADPATNGALKSIYGQLTGDMKAGVSKLGPEASAAAQDANNLYAANEKSREFLGSVIDRAGGPERVYAAATNATKEGASTINGVMGALSGDQQNLVRATVLSRLGRAVPSAQDGPGSQFSPETFLTNWNKQLSPEAKDALFGQSGNPGDLRDGLDKLANTAAAVRAGTKLKNPPGTGPVIEHGTGLLAAWEGVKALLAGNPHVAMGAAGGVVANNILARSLTNPKTVQWLAKTWKTPTSGVPNAVNQLHQYAQQSGDSDAADLADYVAPRVARARGGKVDNLETLVTKLMNRWKAAKRETDKSTKPLLKVPDETIVKALHIAGRSI